MCRSVALNQCTGFCNYQYFQRLLEKERLGQVESLPVSIPSPRQLLIYFFNLFKFAISWKVHANGILQPVAFHVCLLSLSFGFLRFTHEVVSVTTTCFSTAERIEGIFRVLFIHSPVDGHVRRFHFVPMINTAADIPYKFSHSLCVDICFHFSWADICLKILSILRNCQTVLQSGYTILYL